MSEQGLMSVFFRDMTSPIEKLTKALETPLFPISKENLAGKMGDIGGDKPLPLGKEPSILSKMFDGIFKGFKTAMGPIGMLMDFLESLGVFQPVLDVLNAFVAVLGAQLAPITQKLIELILPLMPMMEEIGILLMAIFEPFLPILDMIMGAFMPLLDNFMLLLNVILVPFIPILEQLVTAFGPFLTLNAQLMNAVLVPMIPVITDLLAVIMPALTWFTNIATEIAGKLDSGFDVVLDWFSGFWERVTDRLSSGFENAWEAIKDFFTGG